MELLGFNDVQESLGRFPLLWPAAAPVTLCQYAPGTGVPGSGVPGASEGETVREEIRLTLEGSQAEIERWMDRLTRGLAQARREARVPGGNRVYLVARVSAADAAEWRSPLLDGRLKLGPAGVDQRGAGVQGLTLEIIRADWWERCASQTAWLENSSGNNAYDVLMLSNHSDSAHQQSVNLPAQHNGVDTISGALPPRVMLTYGLPAPCDQAVTLLISQGCRPGVTQLVDAYPGESCTARAGISAAVTASAACASGSYLKLDWTGAGETELFSFDLEWAQAQRLGGYPARLVLRLQDGLSTASTEKLWYRWKIFSLEAGYQTPVIEAPVGESSSQYIDQGQELIFGPALNLPPWLVDGSIPAGPNLRLVLSVQAAGSGAHTLKLDSVTVAPCEGWRIYRPINNKGMVGLVDDAARDQVLARNAFYQTHTVEGPGFVLYPGQEARFWVFALRHDETIKSAPVDLSQWVSIAYYARRQSL